MKRWSLLLCIFMLGLGIAAVSCSTAGASETSSSIPEAIRQKAYEMLNDPAYSAASGVNVHYSIDNNGNYSDIKVILNDPQKYENDKAAVAKAADEFYNNYIEGKIPEGSIDWRFKREMEIIKFMVANIDYAYNRDMIYDDYSAYGALINHQAVCDGYAKCFNVLAKRCGIESAKVNGNGHAWNIVRLDDGNYYHLDVCWEDPIVNGEPNKIYGYERLRNTYINITSDKIKEIGGEPHAQWIPAEYDCSADVYGTDKVNRYFIGLR